MSGWLQICSALKRSIDVHKHIECHCKNEPTSSRSCKMLNNFQSNTLACPVKSITFYLFCNFNIFMGIIIIILLFVSLSMSKL